MLYDKDIREPLFEFLEETYGKSRILEEKQIGHSRADVVMVTEEALYGIEIKSDADTYQRLARQVKDYNLYYDYNIVVVGVSHSLHIEEHVPDFWGIITVAEEASEAIFSFLRKPLPNPKMKWLRKLELLWRPELAHIQELNSMSKYKTSSKKFVMEKILEKVPLEILQPQIMNELFERDYTTIAETIAAFREENNLPVKKRRRRYRKRR